MLDPSHVRDYVIRPAFAILDEAQPGIASPVAERLMLGTAVYESTVRGDTYLRQLPDGPALSIWQIEPATVRLVNRWLARSARRTALREALASLAAPGLPVLEQLPGNLLLACGYARVLYWSIREPLPLSVRGMASYYKRHYNTEKGKGSADGWVHAYRKHVAPIYV